MCVCVCVCLRARALGPTSALKPTSLWCQPWGPYASLTVAWGGLWKECGCRGGGSGHEDPVSPAGSSTLLQSDFPLPLPSPGQLGVAGRAASLVTDWQTVAKIKQRGRNGIECNLWTEDWALSSAISFIMEALRRLVVIILLRQENTHGRYYYYSHFTDAATRSQSSEEPLPACPHCPSHF